MKHNKHEVVIFGVMHIDEVESTSKQDFLTKKLNFKSKLKMYIGIFFSTQHQPFSFFKDGDFKSSC